MARPRPDRGSTAPPSARLPSVAWLLAQVGGHAAIEFSRRLEELDLTPPHAGVLRALASSGDLSQQALAKRLDVFPSRLVALLDELESRGLVERRNHPDDRRRYAVRLTDAGRGMLDSIGRVSREHQQALCAALSADEREQLAGMLLRIAEQQGLRPGVHPGFRTLGRGRGRGGG